MKHPYDEWWETDVHRILLGSVQQDKFSRPIRLSSSTLENCKHWVEKLLDYDFMLKLSDVHGKAAVNVGMGRGWIIWPSTAGNWKRHTLKNKNWTVKSHETLQF